MRHRRYPRLLSVEAQVACQVVRSPVKFIRKVQPIPLARLLDDLALRHSVVLHCVCVLVASGRLYLFLLVLIVLVLVLLRFEFDFGGFPNYHLKIYGPTHHFALLGITSRLIVIIGLLPFANSQPHPFVVIIM